VRNEESVGIRFLRHALCFSSFHLAKVTRKPWLRRLGSGRLRFLACSSRLHRRERIETIETRASVVLPGCARPSRRGPGFFVFHALNTVGATLTAFHVSHDFHGLVSVRMLLGIRFRYRWCASFVERSIVTSWQQGAYGFEVGRKRIASSPWQCAGCVSRSIKLAHDQRSKRKESRYVHISLCAGSPGSPG